MRFSLAYVASMLAVGVGFISPSAAQANPVIQGGTEVSTNFFLAAGFMQGYDFVSSSDQSLTALGFWDQGSNGLPGAFQVGLWRTDTQTLLANVLIDSADVLDTSVTVEGGQWRYETLISALTLTSGTKYTLGWQTGTSPISFQNTLLLSYPSISVDPGVTIANQARFSQTSAFAFPTETFVAGDFFSAMGNAQLTPTAVPEPATLALVGAAMVGIAATRRRKQ